MPTPTPKTWNIGRRDDNDIVIPISTVSGYHCRITSDGITHTIEDLGSSNGTFLNSRRLEKGALTPFSPIDAIFLGTHQFYTDFLPTPQKPEPSPQQGGRHDRTIIQEYIVRDQGTVGRDPLATVHLDNPSVSWNHARIIQSGGEIWLEDLESSNGTFVNAERIRGKRRINTSDMVAFGTCLCQVMLNNGLKLRLFTGNIRVDADRITLEVPTSGGKKRLLDEISLTVYPSEFTALMGPSGAGKTTLLNVMNGYNRPTSGTCRINGVGVHDGYDFFRGSIGYVPQDDIMHPELTVYEALYYTARLRLDLKNDEIAALIDRILARLGMDASLKSVEIGSPEKKGISGGQRKRVNLAMELLTEPPLLFLDEPTSGLSALDARRVTELLRGLADDGATIVLTIHQPSLTIYKMFDNVIILAPGGKLAYYGKAWPDSLTYFSQGREGGDSLHDPDAPLEALQEEEYLVAPGGKVKNLRHRPPDEWKSRYNNSGNQYYQAFVAGRREQGIEAPPLGKLQRIRRRVNLKQWWILTRRYAVIKLRDHKSLAMQLLMGPAIALGLGWVFRGDDAPLTGPLFMLVITSLWLGATSASGEIVGERAIYDRERMVNLKIPSYIFSKTAILSILGVCQSVGLLSLLHLLLGFKGSFAVMLAVSLLSNLTGIALGLAISALAKTKRMADTLVPLCIIPMIIFGGALLPIGKMPKEVWWAANVVPSRMAFEMVVREENSQRARERKPATPIPAPATADKAPQAAPEPPKERDMDLIKALFTVPKTGEKRTVDELSAVMVLMGESLAMILAAMLILKSRDRV